MAIKNSYINDSGTLVQEMEDGTVKKYGAAGNVVDLDSSGNLVSNVAGGHTLGSDLTNKETVDLSDKQTQYLSSTFGNPKMSGRKYWNPGPDQEKFGKMNADNLSARDYGGRDGILRGRGSRVVDLVNQGANVYVADDGAVMLQTPDGSEAKLNYGAAMQAYNNNLISGGKATWSTQNGEDTDDDTEDDNNTDDTPVVPSQPVAPEGIPASIAIEPSTEDVNKALEIFTSEGVNLPTGVNRMEDTVSDTPTLEGGEGTTEVDVPTYESKTQAQSKNFEQRAKDQAQLIRPQTLAEKTAAGTIGKLEQRLYRNSMGMNTYILGVYNNEGVWTASQGIPQGYVPVKQETTAMNEGGTVTVKDKDGNIITLNEDEMAQEQGDLIGQAVVNPSENVAAASPNQMTGNETGTVLESTTGQTSGVAPIVNDPAQVDQVTTADTPDKPEVTQADLGQTQEDVQNVLDDTQAQQGSVSQTIDGVTQDSTQISDMEAEQGTATTVEGTPTRVLDQGELVSGSTVDQGKVGEVFGTGQVKAASVQDELTGLMNQFEGGNTPPWAAGAMRGVMSQLNARGLSASSLAGQAMIQAAMESALPIAQIDAGNKQQMALESARQRAGFLQMEFDQNFQTKVMNAAKVSEVANINFNAQQQVALENAKMAQTMNLTNLSNKQALVMAEAAQISQLEMASLNNRQQAQVQNAQNFLQMDMANLSNAQATEIFKAQTMANTLLSDTAAFNANAQFNASSDNQVNQFFAQMQSQLNQFNSAQTNAMKQFNSGETNSILKFNSELQNGREQFNASMYAQIAQANAKWRQDTTTANNSFLNQSNFQYAKDVNGLTNKVMDQIWQRERDIMSFAFTGSENAMERTTRLLLGDKTLQGIREQTSMQEDVAKTSFFAKLLFGTTGISPFGDGGAWGWMFPDAGDVTTGE